MVVSECAKIAGLQSLTLTYGWGDRTYWGHYTNGGLTFQVLAIEKEHNIVFQPKPWNVIVDYKSRPTSIVGLAHKKTWTDSIEDRMGALDKKLDSVGSYLNRRVDESQGRQGNCEVQLELLTKKVDTAIVKAQTRRDLLSQRLDYTMSKVLAVEKELHREEDCPINRLDDVIHKVQFLGNKVAGLTQKVHDAGRILNNPPIRAFDNAPGSYYPY